MEKIASQMLDKLKTWVDENPELVKTTLLTSGLGAAAAAALTGKESEHERTSTRVKRRIRNALFGALAAGGSVGLLNYAGKNLSTAKLKNAPTPEEKFDKAIDDTTNAVGDALTSPGALAGAGAFGSYKGLRKSLARTNEEAARVLNSIASNTEIATGLNPQTGEAITKKLNLFGVPTDGLKADKNGVFSGTAKLLKSDANSRAVKDLVGMLSTNADDNLKNFGLNMTKSELNDLLRRAGLDNADDTAKGIWGKSFNKLRGLGRRNWRVGAGAALGTGAMAGLGALIGNLSED